MNKPTIAFAQELLGYLPGRPDYSEWLTCISAIGNTFDESTALKLLSEKFKDEKPNEHLHKLNNRVKSTGFGSLVWLAKEYGYKMPAISRQKLAKSPQTQIPSPQNLEYTDELLYRFVNGELEERAAIYQYYDNLSREEADNRVLQEFPDVKRERVYRVCINKEVIDKNLNRDNLPHLKANGNPDFEPLTTNFKNYYLTLQEIMEMVMLGFSIVFCSMKADELGNTRRCSASFVEADLFALDFDKGIQIPDFIDLAPEGLIGIYTTCSHTEENHRFRAIFELPFCVKQGNCYSQLVKKYADFYNADKTTDCCRVFYGSSEGIYINYLNGVNMSSFNVKPYVPMTKAGVLGFLNEKKEVPQKKKLETMQEKLARGRAMPKMKKIFASYFHQGELTILAGQSNVGKSLLAFQIADGISKGEDILEQRNECEPQKVIYYDFEMSVTNLINRYPNYNSNENIIAPDIDDLLKEHDGVFDLDIINQHIKEEKASVVIIDNISAIAMKSLQDQNESLRLIKAAKQLVSGGNLSILLLAHTPKIYGVKPIELKDIAGSANIGNLCDSAFFICKSREGAGRRYIKQVKSRNAEMIEQCLIADIKQLDYLKLDFVALDDERNHLKIEEDRTNAKRNEFINLAEEVFSNAESLTRKEIIDRISDLKKLSENGARHRFDKLIENELITKRDGKYILNT